MQLIKETQLPFRKAVLQGNIVYICDLGNIRLVATSTTILDGGEYSYINLLTGASIKSVYSLKLPAKLKLTPYGTIADAYEISVDPLTILKCGRQYSEIKNTDGTLSVTSHDSKVVIPNHLIFSFRHKMVSGDTYFNNLQGIIVSDKFAVLPTSFKTKLLSESIIGGESTTETINFVYGNEGVDSPYDSFVADNLEDMLTLIIKQGDRCYRTDLSVSFVNTTGENSSIDDWDILGSGSGSGVSLEVVQDTIDDAIVGLSAHANTISGNPHHVTKAEVGLGSVPNTDFTSAVAANTAKVGITSEQAAAIIANSTHSAITSGNPHHVTKSDVGLSNVPNTDFTSRIEALEVSGGNSEIPLAISTHVITVSGNPHNVTKADVGLGSVPNVDFTSTINANTAARHNHDNKITLDAITAAFTVEHANAISANTMKVGITSTQANAIVANTAKVGITTEQANAIVANTAKVGITPEQAAAIVANTAKVGITQVQADAIIANSAKVGITQVQADAIIANSAKVGITPEQTAAIVVNSAKVGITPQQIADISSANNHRSIISGNPHNVTKSEIGLGNVPDHDFTDEVAANTAKVGISSAQANAIIANTTHSSIISGNPHRVTKIDIGLDLVPNTDFTNHVNLSDIHRQIETGNPHHVTKADVGLSNVPNTDFTADVVDANNHIGTVAGNPHQVTKADVGLSNVPNVDCTNASNITTGILPSSVLPALAITDTFVVNNELEQFTLTVQKGDVVVRTDLNQSFINKTGSNAMMTDWQELLTPTDTVVSVNGQVGIINLSTSNIAEDTNLYYTEDRVSANSDVALNTANRHNHMNKAVLDATTASFTSEQAAAILVNNNKIGITLAQIDIINDADTHINTLSGNPHNVTKSDVGLGNVPNHDFTTEINLNTAKVGITVQQAGDIISANTHRATVTGNPHHVTKAEVGLSNVPNTDFTADVTQALNHIALTSGNPHNVTKGDIGLSNVPNTDFTLAVAANTAHRTTITGNPHNVTKAEIGLSNVPNTDFTLAVAANTAKVGITTQQAADIISSNVHRTIVTGNPHHVTKTEVGLGNVPNIDCTNASNITSGTLPTSVLPPLTISETFVVVDETEQLALTVQKGDVAIRTDLNKSFINYTGNNTDISDWQELLTPTDAIISVNGKVGVVILTTLDIAEDTNLYYTEARVSANSDVAANTVARHSHTNKMILDATTASFTTEDVLTLSEATAHQLTTSGNPHQVTKVEVGLGNVPNTDFTLAVAANTAKVGITPEQAAAIVDNTTHRVIVTGNPHNVTKSEIGLGLVPNHDFTLEVTANTAHTLIVAGNPHNVTKSDVGLGNVPNHDFTAEVAANTAKVGITPEQAAAIITNTAKVGITPEQAAAIIASTAHDAIVTGNPHHVTKTDVGLSNVPNIDCTNASNITTGTLPTSVLPPLAITDIWTCSSETEMFGLTVQKGDIAIRTDINRSYINLLGGNGNYSDWQELMTPTDTVLSVNGQVGTIVLTTSNIDEGSNLYYTEDRVSANSNVALNTANRHNHTNKAILDNISEAFTSELKDNILANNAKVGITPEQITAIDINTAKVGITVQQAADIISANTHRAIVSGNPHQVTKSDVGLSNVPNTNFTADIIIANAHIALTSGNPHQVTKAEVGLGDVPNTDFTAAIAANTAHRNIITGNPHQVTKAEVGLGNVPNIDFTSAVAANTAKVGITPTQAAAIIASTTHDAITSGNPHRVTKAEVGLGNVPNIDCTNASNITTGTLPTSVLPPLAISETFVVTTEIEQLALTVQKGDVAVRTDLKRSYINKTGNNTAITDWQELMTPTDTVLSVNGQVGAVVLSTSNITEGSRLYYTEARVSANTNVAANTAARHSHTNKTILDTTTASFTTDKDTTLANFIIHRNTITGNPHNVTKGDVGLGNVPNADFTNDISNSNAHIATITGNPHQVTKAEVGLGNVPNHDFTAEVNLNTAKVGITPTQAAAIIANTAKVGITPDQITIINNSNNHINTTSGNPHNVTKADVGLSNVPNTDFTSEMAVNNAKVGITSQQAFDIVSANTHRAITSGNPHNVTKTDVGLGNVPNTDFTTAVGNANTHINTLSGNPHNVTKSDVGLGNVPNIDCTNASNITSGTLPTSVLPPLAISETFVVATEAAQLALVVQKGDVAVRTDLKRSYINKTGNNTAITDWQELMTPTDTVLSVNGQVGTIVLTTSNIAEGTNLYFTNARVSANSDVTANTAARHSHTNKAILDATTASFTTTQAAAIVVNSAKVGITTQQAADIVLNTAHRNTITGNPHQVTKSDVGLSNVPNTNFTNDITNANIHINTVTGNPHQVTKAEVGLGNVPNTDFTAAVTANTAHRATITGNPHQVTKAEVGLGNVPNTDFTLAVAANTAKVGITAQQAADIISANSHRAIVTGNPHQVTKTEVGLGNVPNIDFTSRIVALETNSVTLTGVQTLTNKTIQNVNLTGSIDEQTGVMADSILRSTNGTIMTKALAANTTFTDGLEDGQSLTLMLTNGSSFTVAWPTITWVSYDGNVSPLIYENNTFVFWKIGTTLFGTFIGSY